MVDYFDPDEDDFDPTLLRRTPMAKRPAPKKKVPLIIPMIEAGFRLLRRQGLSSGGCEEATAFTAHLRACLKGHVTDDEGVWTAMPPKTKQLFLERYPPEMTADGKRIQQQLKAYQTALSEISATKVKAALLKPITDTIEQLGVELAAAAQPMRPQFQFSNRGEDYDSNLTCVWVPLAVVKVKEE